MQIYIYYIRLYCWIFRNCYRFIFANSNSLDEYLISSLLEQGAKIDSFGVGENLITAKSDPVFGGVYKLVAIEENKEIFKYNISVFIKYALILTGLNYLFAMFPAEIKFGILSNKLIFEHPTYLAAATSFVLLFYLYIEERNGRLQI